MAMPLMALAQQVAHEVKLIESLQQQRLSELSGSAPIERDAQLYQSGEHNNASVMQGGGGSHANAAFITQVGAYNNAMLRQRGQGNRSIATQVGENNHYAAEIDGLNNATQVLQQGASNEINQQISGVDLQYTLIQLGNNNSIRQVETSPQSTPYRITQEGNNMHITIEQGRVGAPRN